MLLICIRSIGSWIFPPDTVVGLLFARDRVRPSLPDFSFFSDAFGPAAVVSVVVVGYHPILCLAGMAGCCNGAAVPDD